MRLNRQGTIIGFATLLIVVGGSAATARAEGCRPNQECGGPGGSGGVGGPTGHLYNFFVGADGAPITVTRDGNGNINSATAVGKDGVTRRFTTYTDWSTLYTPQGDYASTQGITYSEYSDSAGNAVTLAISAYTDESGFGVQVTSNNHWFRYGQAANQAESVLDGVKHWGTVAQVRSLIPSSVMPEFSHFDYFKRTYALMWNERYHAGQPATSYQTPGSIDWSRYFGDGVIGALVAVAGGLTGGAGLVAALAVPIADAWQNEPKLRDGTAIIILVCMSIEGIDSFVNPGNALTNPDSLYNQAGCAGY